MNIFEFMYPTFKFKKDKITLFEAFAGIGSQAVALKRLANEFNFKLETIGISEIDKYAIQSYNAIHGETHNFGNITDIQEIPQVDIFTYSFPCQDISLAGNGKGFAKGGGTRSGLLWEVERILEHQHKIGKLPKVLLMENVKALAGTKFVDDFNKWKYKLQELGYSNYWEILNAKDYGIPQNRERVFMISILGEWNYTFPKPFKLKLRLKDMLEDEVDEKYYLSKKQMEHIIPTPNNQTLISYAPHSREHQNQGWKYISPTLAARDYKDPKIIQVGNIYNAKHNSQAGRVYDKNGISPTIETMQGGHRQPKVVCIPEATKKGYAKAYEGDGVYINRPHQKRGVVQKDMIQTIKTSPDVGVVVAGQFQPKDRDYNKKSENREEVFETRQDELSNATLTNSTKNMIKDLHIRKLTPKECWRLMGFSDEHFTKAKQVCSNSQLYKQAGNSIVVDVLYYIFKELIE